MAFPRKMVERIKELEAEGHSLDFAIEVAGYELSGGDDVVVDENGNPIGRHAGLTVIDEDAS